MDVKITPPAVLDVSVQNGSAVNVKVATSLQSVDPFLAIPAGQDIIGHSAVILLNGALYWADISNLEHMHLVLGVAKNSANSGFDVSVQMGGLMQEQSWSWIPGQPVFVGLNGVLTQSIPLDGWLLQVGVATAVDRINIDIKMPFILG